MTNYRRAKFKGGYYFFTVVTHQRRAFLTGELARYCLREIWQKVRNTRPFDVIALCLLPNHLHCIWKLPEGDNDYSTRWSLIKKGFTRSYLTAGGTESPQSKSRRQKRRRGIWQRRFWEHQLRDEHDLQMHVDYIHFNPVKHGLTERPDQWPWSTYHRYIETGRYAKKSLVDLQDNFDNILVGE